MGKLGWNQSLAIKLSITMIALVAVVVFGMSVAVLMRQQEIYRTELQQQADLQLNTLIAAGADALFNLDAQTLQTLMEGLGQNNVVLAGRFYDPEGRIVADAYNRQARFNADPDPLGQKLVKSDGTVFLWEADRLTAGKPMRAGRQVYGALSVSLPTAPLDAKLSEVRVQSLIAGIIAVLGGAVLALLVSRTIIQPLREMTEVTRKVSAGDLSQRIPIRTHDELATLGTAFNYMIYQLRQTINDLKQRAEELRQSEVKQRALIDAIPDIIFRMSGDGIYLDAKTPGGDSLAGTSQDLIGKHINEVLPPHVAKQRLEHIQAALQTHKMQVFEYEITQNNQPVILEGRIVVSGENEVIAIMRDITERKRAELELKEAKEAAEESSRAKSAFLASISHELRTPLNAILGFTGVLKAGMLKDAMPLSESQQDRLKKIETNSRHLRDLINDVLDLAKVESGRMTVIATEANPREFITESVEGVRSLANAKGLTLELNFAMEVPQVVLCDVRKVQQVLNNLLGNAIKFTHTGGVWVDVCSFSPSEWQISVRDTGIGIPNDQVELIFERFRQVDQSFQRQYEGTGLGLALVKSMVELMQGHVAVQTELGRGSTFTVALPQRIEMGVAQDAVNQ